MQEGTAQKQEFSILEFFEISRILEQHHAVFYAMWEMGKPMFSENVERASIRYDHSGECIGFQINPHFWSGLSSYEKSFIVAHECCHILLNHGARKVDASDKEIASIAMDIVVNEMLLRSFKFVKSQVSFADSLCFVDTIFGSESDIPKNEIFEYYFNKIKEMLGSSDLDLDMSLADDHSQMPTQGSGGSGDGEPQDGEGEPQGEDEETEGQTDEDGQGGQVNPFDIEGGMPDWLEDEINTNMSFEEGSYLNAEITDFQEIETDKNMGLMPGKMAGSYTMVIPKEKVKKKRKWETVIKEWSKKYDKQDFDPIEQWSMKNRRMFCLDSELILPSEIDREVDIEGKIDVLFFQDTSGSCAGYAKRFFKAAESLPQDRFNIRLFCFDTKTYETDFKTRKLYGFGGTRFDIIEHRIQSEISKGTIKKYPEAVFVITDGYGNAVYPETPKNWYWFLTPYHSKWCIPKDCNTFDLKDYE